MMIRLPQFNQQGLNPSMLIRPLAYKGPNDHLTQHFSEPLLYQGLQLLLENRLLHWQHEQATQWIHGEFMVTNPPLDGVGENISSELAWPLTRDGNSCSCNNSKPCSHLAALAIESKRRLDQIIYAVKDFHDRNSLWQTELNWLNQQSHNPYSNMARHRLIYLLKRDGDRFYISFYKGYLTQENKYLLKDKFEYSQINLQKVPQFVSLTDQSIIDLSIRLVQQGKALTKGNLLYFTQPDDDLCLSLFYQMVQSHRCFWKASSRPALKLKRQNSIPEHLAQVVKNCFFDVSHNQIIVVSNASSGLPNINSIKPVITIASAEHHFAWRAARPIALDIGKVSFLINNQQKITSNQLIQSQLELTNDAKEEIAKRWRQIQAMPTLRSCHEYPVFQHYDIADRCLTINFSQLCVWLNGLHQEGWQVEFDSSFRFNRETVDNWYLEVNDHKDWFELELGIRVEGKPINIIPYLVRAIKTQQINLANLHQQPDLNIQLEKGQSVIIKGERVKQIAATLIELFDKTPLNSGNRLKLRPQQLHRLSAFTGRESGFDWSSSEFVKQKVKQLSQYRYRKLKLPSEITVDLRKYQQQGVQWLQFLRAHHFGGILADDMGLGKTLQTLIHFVILKHNRQALAPHLVIAPTSLLANWQSEIEKFTPTLNSMVFYGSERQQMLEDFAKVDLVITSYGVLQRDYKLLEKIQFDTLVLDEAQTIKNSRTQIARHCYQLPSSYRLCLTGTPMENHLGELWSLFQFLMPGYLGSESEFNRLYRVPIEKEQNPIVSQALLQRISPFMLRRTKDRVAKELPPKTELYRLIDMPDEQADLYEAVRLSMSEEIQKALLTQGNGKNHLLISNALLRLRQICCHPQLFKLDSNRNVTASGKLDWLKDTLPEMIEEGRRILIFSSFTKMLEIIEDYLAEVKIEYLKLTGQSKDRGQLVEQFQTRNIPVFLISLKAGGSGLNLTAADTVIHFDPWWNPAAEEQASDRAYRIGQDKPVFVYKLITRGTVEERILKMQKAKQKLSDKIYANTAANIKSVIDQDWMELFKPIA